MSDQTSKQPSGLAWAPNVPAHWTVRKLAFLASLKSGDSITADEIKDDGPYPVYGGNGLRGYTDRFTHDGEYALIGRQGALCGNVNYAKGEFWASEHAVVVAPREEVAVRWLGELLRAMELNQYSVSAAQPGLSVETIAALKVPVPPLKEQRAIADYLDRETAQLDALVAAKERVLGLLAEKRRALITRAVTRGLDPRAPLRDSGIPWLGEIPAHWDAPPVYARFEVQLGKMLDEKKIKGTHLVPYLRNVDVQWGAINTSDLPEMDFDEDDRRRYALRAGDILVCEGGEVGRCATWEGTHPECYYQKALHRLRPVGGKDEPAFFVLVMRAIVDSGQFALQSSAATIQHLPAEKLRVVRYPAPPLDEQRAIVAGSARKQASSMRSQWPQNAPSACSRNGAPRSSLPP